MITASDGLELLMQAGIAARIDGPAQISLKRQQSWNPVRVTVQQRPLHRTDATSVRHTDGARDEKTLFVVPRVTAAARDLAADDFDIMIAGVHDAVVIIDGKQLLPEATDPVEPDRAPLRRRPWGRFALIRALARTSQPRTQNELADETGLTQPAISQALRTVAVERAASGWRASDPLALWNTFLHGYPGPGGITVQWFGLAPIREQAMRTQLMIPDALLSGDVAADELAPWRKPTRAVLYATHGTDLAEVGFAPAPATASTLELVVPADPTILRSARAWAAHPHGALATVDPLVVAWDVQRASGADAAEAVTHLRDSTLVDW